MGVQTTYDDMRDRLREDLEKCLVTAKELVISEDVWGYDEMRKGYAMDVYIAVKKAVESV